jgi:uncharacterized membrane protein YozB (DUF420 family)
LPVQWLYGPVAAYNVATLGNLSLAGLGAYALAYRVSGLRTGALLAGVAFLTTPHLLGQAYNGISETLAAGWLPLALLALREADHRPSALRGGLAGLVLGLCFVANWYYGLFGALCGVGLLTRQLLRLRGRLGFAVVSEPVPWGRLSGTLVASAVGLALVVGGPLLLFSRSMSASDALVSRDPAFVWTTLVLHNMTDVVSLLRPGRHYSPDLLEVFGEHLIVVVYLGHALLWPALAALALSNRGAARSWGLMAAAFTVLMLGPYLYVGGDYVTVLGGWVPLPFLALFEWVPVFTRLSHPYRAVVPVTLALCVMLALFIKAARHRGWPSGRLALGLGLARVLEALYGSPAVFPLPVVSVEVPPVYQQLDGGAVLDLPVGIPVLARSKVGIYQMVHQQPIPYGLNDPTPPLLYRNRYSHYLLELERSTVSILPARYPALDLELGRRALVDAGLRWIVVHKAEYPATQRVKVSMFLDRTATAVYDDAELRVYRLPLAGEGGSSSASALAP